MITSDDYLSFWQVHYGYVKVPDDELTGEIWDEAQVLVGKINDLLDRFGEERSLTSGWRPVEVNKLIPGAALRSKHQKGQAADIEDHDGSLDQFCLDNPDIMEELELWQEDPGHTKGWCHIQIVPYASWSEGKPRQFMP